jgi:hypothetical protein
MEGATRVAIGMTESEVSRALGDEPSQRKGTDVAWRLEQGAHPGVAVGSFIDGHMTGITFTANLDTPAPLRIEKAAADALNTTDITQRSVDGRLTLAEIEAAVGARGRRLDWTLAMGQGRSTRSISHWVWEINPGGKVLIVSEEGGKASQPFVRTVNR